MAAVAAVAGVAAVEAMETDDRQGPQRPRGKEEAAMEAAEAVSVASAALETAIEKTVATAGPPGRASHRRRSAAAEGAPDTEGAASAPTKRRASEAAQLLWKTSRGPTAAPPTSRTQPRPPRRGSLLAPTKITDVGSPITRPPPMHVLYAAPLERQRQIAEGQEDGEEEVAAGPKPPAAESPAARWPVSRRRRRSHAPTEQRMSWHHSTAHLVSEILQEFTPTPKSIPEEDELQEEELREVDYDAGRSLAQAQAQKPDKKRGEARGKRQSKKQVTLSEEQPKEQPKGQRPASGAPEEDHRTLIARGRRAYRSLMAGETPSTKDLYKMMLDLAWRHRNDKVPPPLPSPPPARRTSLQPQRPAVHTLREKITQLPSRPPARPQPYVSEDNFFPRPGRLRASMGLRPRLSSLLDPASWAPPPKTSLGDPHAPPLPGRVPRGWINILEIGSAM